MDNLDIDLGFAEKNKNRFELTALHYPSKLGGRPAWLRWDKLPTSQHMQCDSCGKQLVYLCQLYVPTEKTDNNNTVSFHKMVYLFCCLHGDCYKKTHKSVKAFRSVKTESSTDVTDEDLKLKTDQELLEMLKTIESEQPLCNVCGCFGDKKCSSCHTFSYCSKDHQVFDWKKGGHSKTCKGKNGLYILIILLFEPFCSVFMFIHAGIAFCAYMFLQILQNLAFSDYPANNMFFFYFRCRR